MPRCRIDLASDAFCRDLEEAKKTHASLGDDLAEAFAALEDHFDIGDWIPGVGAHVRKMRVGVKKANIGKRKGYRLIYAVNLKTNVITPIRLHYKPDIPLLPPKEIAEALKAILEKHARVTLDTPSASDTALSRRDQSTSDLCQVNNPPWQSPGIVRSDDWRPPGNRGRYVPPAGFPAPRDRLQ